MNKHTTIIAQSLLPNIILVIAQSLSPVIILATFQLSLLKVLVSQQQLHHQHPLCLQDGHNAPCNGHQHQATIFIYPPVHSVGCGSYSLIQVGHALTECTGNTISFLLHCSRHQDGGVPFPLTGASHAGM